jgi:hypothetical protein
MNNQVSQGQTNNGYIRGDSKHTYVISLSWCQIHIIRASSQAQVQCTSPLALTCTTERIQQLHSITRFWSVGLCHKSPTCGRINLVN